MKTRRLALLVVPLRRLGTVFREIPEPAAHQAVMTARRYGRWRRVLQALRIRERHKSAREFATMATRRRCSTANISAGTRPASSRPGRRSCEMPVRGNAGAATFLADFQGGSIGFLPGGAPPRPFSGFGAKCEACHIRPAGLALSVARPGVPSIEDATNENAADDILVVLVRRLRTISREIPEFAIRRSRGASVGKRGCAFDRAALVSPLL